MKRKNILPPWAKAGDEFFSLCNKCGNCIEKCPHGIIKKGLFDYPKVEFKKNFCDFCKICADVCETKAIDKNNKPAWEHKVQVKKSCLSMKGVMCRACGDVCSAEAIEFRLETGGKSTPIIDLDLCTGCGECLVKCLNQSIEVMI